ncbi:MAG TPA: 3-octaprenyl-4-hydroxybenzoate carboxy-lyase, partial [Segetibacter sp.]
EVLTAIKDLQGFKNPKVAMPGVVVLEATPFRSYDEVEIEMNSLSNQLKEHTRQLNSTPLIIIADDSDFTSATLKNYLWVTYTRCNPSHDIYGVDSFVRNKHWGCNGPLIIDARIKPHHAPAVEKDPVVEKKINRLFEKGGSLYGVLKH